MTCKCAKRRGEFHGWVCSVTGGACAFLLPDSRLCAAVYGEGPDAENIKQGPESVKAIQQENKEQGFFNMLV